MVVVSPTDNRAEEVVELGSAVPIDRSSHRPHQGEQKSALQPKEDLRRNAGNLSNVSEIN